MSLSKKAPTVRGCEEELAACLDQKNNIISLLQAEVIELRTNQERFDRAKEHLLRSRANYENLLRETDCTKDNNQERLEVSSKAVFELKVQIEHLENQLRSKSQLLRDAKFGCQQLMEQQNRREDEAADIQIKLQEQRSMLEFRKMEEERIKLQIVQLKEEVDRQRRENSAIKSQSESVNDKGHKTQSYIRNLLREETNLNDNLTHVEDENNSLDSSITNLEEVIATNNQTMATIEKECQECLFLIASKELERKRIDNQIREKAKNLTVQRERLRSNNEQLEQRKADGYRLDNQLKESCEEVNFIAAKNAEILEVNEQLREDLKVCQRHLENVLRTNKTIEGEVALWEDGNLLAIKKLQSVLKPAGNAPVNAKWSCSSWRTGVETAPLEKPDRY